MALDTMRDRDATAAAPDGPAALGERLLDAAAAAACLDDTASSSNGEAPAPAARLRRRSLRERLLAEEAGEEDEGEGGAPRLPPGAPGPAPVRLLQDAATLVRLTLRLYARLWTGASQGCRRAAARLRAHCGGAARRPTLTQPLPAPP
jgi:hypothetical protein